MRNKLPRNAGFGEGSLCHWGYAGYEFHDALSWILTGHGLEKVVRRRLFVSFFFLCHDIFSEAKQSVCIRDGIDERAYGGYDVGKMTILDKVMIL
jgi:hypothetical protein